MTTTTAGTTTTSTDGKLGARGVREVDPAAVRDWLASGACELVDVREPDEHARERIAGARLAPLSKLDARALAPAGGKRVVFHCKSGRRSMDAARAVAAVATCGEVCTMTGGIERWKAESMPVETDTARPRMSVMQQTQLVIGLMVLTGVAVGYFVHPLGFVLSALMGGGLTMAGVTGLCPLASAIAKLPWNRVAGGSCATGRCG